MAYSKNFKRKFFFNKMTNESTFDLPSESIAPFQWVQAIARAETKERELHLGLHCKHSLVTSRACCIDQPQSFRKLLIWICGILLWVTHLLTTSSLYLQQNASDWTSWHPRKWRLSPVTVICYISVCYDSWLEVVNWTVSLSWFSPNSGIRQVTGSCLMREWGRKAVSPWERVVTGQSALWLLNATGIHLSTMPRQSLEYSKFWVCLACQGSWVEMFCILCLQMDSGDACHYQGLCLWK